MTVQFPGYKSFSFALNKKSKQKQSAPDYSSVAKSKDFIKYVADRYRAKGYTVWRHNRIKEHNSDGIDLVAKKENEVILIQCKEWEEEGKWKIEHDHIRRLMVEERDFIDSFPVFKSCGLIIRFALSDDVIHETTRKHIDDARKNGKCIDYEII